MHKVFKCAHTFKVKCAHSFKVGPNIWSETASTIESLKIKVLDQRFYFELSVKKN